jgi:hypothetical protein
MKTAIQRFEEKYEPIPESGCWLWTAYTNSWGYGYFRFNGRWGRAHRFSYEYFVGEIPKGLGLDHLCRVRNCVNPDHLEPVTNRENALRGEGGGNMSKRTKCPQGHKYSGENLIIRSVNTGRGIIRECRSCRAIWRRNHYLKTGR